MEFGDDFARVVHGRFRRLVRHYARKWILVNRVVLKGPAPGQYHFNESVTSTCFGSVDIIEGWLRLELRKLNPWEKEMLAPFFPVVS
ncbi:hypothetical protein ColLi_09148 [Colletotrichum liriopes]|uniref:Uncharacterized protein n=1 Tax=Colletotrichum liriopes TaxID=708192 RepID=A0AA37GT57_9PEZI|nr:hypothetical protein ColLi_09148 [Colletotrichum liriopes]